jgi:GT2 family glycosyltransferase
VVVQRKFPNFSQEVSIWEFQKKAFLASNGFGNIHPGEDPDLSIRLWKMGFETRLISNAFVYHKRRIDWNKFYTQVNKFGKARPILNSWYPEYSKITFWFPALFLLGFLASILLFAFSFAWFLFLYLLYFGAVFLLSTIKKKYKDWILQHHCGFYTVLWLRHWFLKSFTKVRLLKQKPEIALPEMFFKK